MKGVNLNTILIIAIAIFATIQLKSCFDKYHKPEEMIRNEERLKYLETERLKDSVTLVETRGRYDSLILLSTQKSSQLQTQYQTVKKVYEKIPTIINDFDREQLRRAVANWQ